MAGQTCPLCRQAILPGDHVAYQRGELVHLDCYADLEAQTKAGAQDED